jgi:hypothetical protein
MGSDGCFDFSVPQGHVVVRDNLLIFSAIVGYGYLFFCYALP